MATRTDGRRPGGTHTTGLVVIDGPTGTVGTYYNSGGVLNSDGGTLDVAHPTAGGGTTVVREGGSVTLPLSAAPGAGQYPLAGWWVDWGDGSPADGAGAAATSDSHTYVDGGDTDTAQADAIYGAGGYDAVGRAKKGTFLFSAFQRGRESLILASL